MAQCQPTQPPRSAPSATRRNLRCSARLCRLTCRSSACAAACSCSISPTAARSSSIFRTSVGHDGHRTQPGCFDLHSVSIAPDSRVGAICGPQSDRQLGSPPGNRGRRRWPGCECLGRGRLSRGARGSHPRVRRRRPVAPRGGRRPAAVYRAGECRECVPVAVMSSCAGQAFAAAPSARGKATAPSP